MLMTCQQNLISKSIYPVSATLSRMRRGSSSGLSECLMIFSLYMVVTSFIPLSNKLKRHTAATSGPHEDVCTLAISPPERKASLPSSTSAVSPLFTCRKVQEDLHLARNVPFSVCTALQMYWYHCFTFSQFNSIQLNWRFISFISRALYQKKSLQFAHKDIPIDPGCQTAH